MWGNSLQLEKFVTINDAIKCHMEYQEHESQLKGNSGNN